MPRRESLYAKHPDYRVDLVPQSERFVVRLGNAVIADSTRTLRVEETRHAPVVYFPRDDVRMELLEPSAHETFCPFKGDASYYSVRTDDGLEPDVVWTYDDPFEEVAGLADYLAFYPDRSVLERIDEQPARSR